MSGPLASPSDLFTRLGIEVPGAGSNEYKQAELILADASGEIEAVIGQPIAKQQSTVNLFADGWSGRNMYVDLPARPVHSVDKVKLAGYELFSTKYKLRNVTLILPFYDPDEPIEVTFTHGYDPIPAELAKWTCMLAASQIASTVSTGSLGMVAGTSQSTITIDDFTEGWANYTGNKIPGLSLPPDIMARLRATYGAGGVETLRFR